VLRIILRKVPCLGCSALWAAGADRHGWAVNSRCRIIQYRHAAAYIFFSARKANRRSSPPFRQALLCYCHIGLDAAAFGRLGSRERFFATGRFQRTLSDVPSVSAAAGAGAGDERGNWRPPGRQAAASGLRGGGPIHCRGWVFFVVRSAMPFQRHSASALNACVSLRCCDSGVVLHAVLLIWWVGGAWTDDGSWRAVPPRLKRFTLRRLQANRWTTVAGRAAASAMQRSLFLLCATPPPMALALLFNLRTAGVTAMSRVHEENRPASTQPDNLSIR